MKTGFSKKKFYHRFDTQLIREFPPQVSKSRIFRREGADIHSDVTISLAQAILGGTKRIPGIYDDIVFVVSILIE